MAASAELRSNPEIQADRLGVTDMQVAIRLGRKTSDHLGHAPGIDICLDDVANEVASRFGRRRFGRRPRFRRRPRFSRRLSGHHSLGSRQACGSNLHASEKFARTRPNANRRLVIGRDLRYNQPFHAMGVT